MTEPAEFTEWFRTVGIPGEYDGWDEYDQRKWRSLLLAAFELGRGVNETTG